MALGWDASSRTPGWGGMNPSGYAAGWQPRLWPGMEGRFESTGVGGQTGGQGPMSGSGGPFGGLLGGLRQAISSMSSRGATDDPILRQMRDMAMADAAAQQRGARSAARVSAPGDPSMAAWADLNALVGGQSDVSRSLMGASYQRLSEKDRRAWDEYMMRLQSKLQEDAMRRAQSGGLMGDIGSLAGMGIGAYFGGPLGAQFGSQLGGMAGGR